MLYCKYCGSKHSDTAKFCPKCGRSVDHILGDQSIEPNDIAKDLILPKRTNKTTLFVGIGFFVIASSIFGLLFYKNPSNLASEPRKAETTTNNTSRQSAPNDQHADSSQGLAKSPPPSNEKPMSNTPITLCRVEWGAPPILAWRAYPKRQFYNQVFGPMVSYDVSGLDFSCLLGEYKPDGTYLAFAAGDKLEIITWNFSAKKYEAQKVKNYLINKFGPPKIEYSLGRLTKVSIWGNKGGYVQSFINDYKIADFSLSYSRELYD